MCNHLFKMNTSPLKGMLNFLQKSYEKKRKNEIQKTQSWEAQTRGPIVRGHIRHLLFSQNGGAGKGSSPWNRWRLKMAKHSSSTLLSASTPNLLWLGKNQTYKSNLFLVISKLLLHFHCWIPDLSSLCLLPSLIVFLIHCNLASCPPLYFCPNPPTLTAYCITYSLSGNKVPNLVKSNTDDL